MLKGAGLALALPMLDGMTWAAPGTSLAKRPPKRLVVTYISYGVYEPKPQNGKHHDWSWWPCDKPGDLTFNKSTAPFQPLKQYVTYLRGLDHPGGYGMGGHSSGDVFATGADMSGAETKNNISDWRSTADGVNRKFCGTVVSSGASKSTNAFASSTGP